MNQEASEMEFGAQGNEAAEREFGAQGNEALEMEFGAQGYEAEHHGAKTAIMAQGNEASEMEMASERDFSDELGEAIEVLHREGCSCVIINHGEITICHERGVKDLLRILKTEREKLNGAAIADKVIGKGAAALMILGGVKAVYADVISEPALKLFADSGAAQEGLQPGGGAMETVGEESTAGSGKQVMKSISVVYGKLIANIINRAGTGICPVESRCMDCKTAAECLPRIEEFVKGMKKGSAQ